MRVLVLGGTGAIGLLQIRDLLEAEHTVVVYARSPQKLPDDITNNPNVTVIKGELNDVDTIAMALEGVEAVVSSLGPTASNPPDTPLAKGYSVFIKCMREAGIKRLIALGTASITDELDQKDSVFWLAVQAVKYGARNAYKDIVAVGQTIRNEGADLDWTIARVPILTNGQTREYQAGYLGDGKRNTTLTRIGFSTFVVDELKVNEWIKKAPFLSVP
ncbi:NAD-binding protein [Fomitiporia mediterranea MF3/22]|uniref:NAD-binding protein n=1 Tax=Fomitiporia mediterranea (strain MF3/22) TaxID=694068 RepID=UPI000440817E|nr:NAD-binding protein [Fomitiporia mediterranea MF3/22]EJD02146.1 NAD-binding protein [Fomitiporia mediterranea MF3/22]